MEIFSIWQSKVKGKKGKKAEELEAARLAAAEEAARLEDGELMLATEYNP